MDGISVLLALITFSIIIITVIRTSDNKTINYYLLYAHYSAAVVITCVLNFLPSLLNPHSSDNLMRSASIFNALLHNDLFKIRWTVTNIEIIQKDETAVLVANHQSLLDMMGMTLIWPYMKRCTVTCKKEILFYPLIGISAWLWGMIFVDRRNPKEAVKSLRSVTDLLLSTKAKLWFFPEGTRGGGKKLLPFKKGAFYTAVQMQKPIIPIVISPYNFIDFERRTFNGEGNMTISILGKIPTIGLTENDVVSLMEKTYKLMEAEFNRLSESIVEQHKTNFK